MSDKKDIKNKAKDGRDLDLYINEKLNNAEGFINENKQSLLIISCSVAAMILLYIGYAKFYLGPRETEAQSQMFRAEYYFRADSLDKALNGDGNYPGFLGILEEYKGSEAANLAYYYSGICYLKKGDYKKAADYLSDYSGKDDITGTKAWVAIGDAYSQLKDYKKAINYYEKAADEKLEGFTPGYLMKLALVYENTDKQESALKVYKKIKTDYSDSDEARDIEKYIARIEARINLE